MQFIPSLYASWTLTQQVSEPGGFSSPDNSRWFIGLTLSVPIYDHTRYADLDQKRVSRSRARLEVEDTRRQVALHVRQARREYEQFVALVATAGKKVSLAGQSLDLAETAYENGTGSSLDVTDARRSSRAAEIDLATKRFGAQLALLKLLRTAGEDLRAIGGTGGGTGDGG
jgi:outer membrane protein